MLEICKTANTWLPPSVDIEKLVEDAKGRIGTVECTQYLYIFQIVPFIDSLLVVFDSDGEPEDIRRYTFHEGYAWTQDDEDCFSVHCVKQNNCLYDGGAIEQIFVDYQALRPEWHIKRYYTKGLRILDHIYNCLKKNTAKELLYKAGLDELAANIDSLDELNLLASSPSDIYDGISLKVLRSLNCYEGSVLLRSKENRDYIKNLNLKFPDLFREKLNDAQCRYIDYLIKGDLTVGETGRLFESRKADLAFIWIKSLYDVFMLRDVKRRNWDSIAKVYTSIDPIYADYIKNLSEPVDDNNIQLMNTYLLNKREEYDKAIRRSNRKRKYEWQERSNGYVIRYPQTCNDFCREAVYMRNCLLSYIEAYIHNDTTILFMRKPDSVNTPFITIEIYGDELMQAYHRFNEDCSEEEAEWIRTYCRRHGISVGKFKFNNDFDELF